MGEWKCALRTDCGVLYVMKSGMKLMLVWYADNLDIIELVSGNIIVTRERMDLYPPMTCSAECAYEYSNSKAHLMHTKRKSFYTLYNLMSSGELAGQTGPNSQLISLCPTGHMAVGEVSVFGSGNGKILMSNVNCSGDEKSLSSCSIAKSKPETCDHTEDAGVICHNDGDGKSLM